MASKNGTRPSRRRSTAKIVNIQKWRVRNGLIVAEGVMRYPAKVVGFRRFKYWW